MKARFIEFSCRGSILLALPSDDLAEAREAVWQELVETGMAVEVLDIDWVEETDLDETVVDAQHELLRPQLAAIGAAQRKVREAESEAQRFLSRLKAREEQQ